MTIAKASQHNNFEDTVSIVERGNKYRLNFSRKTARNYFNKETYQISSGLTVSPANYAALVAKCSQIHLDALAGHLDTTLARYGLKNKSSAELTVIQSIKTEPTLKQLWEMYTQAKRHQVTITTFNGIYITCANHIEKLPSQNIRDVQIIREYVINNLKPTAQTRLIVNLNACCKWAMKNKFITDNPFEDIIENFREKQPDEIEWFSKEEMNAIIKAFEEHPTRSHYAPFVKFLFWTGCRTGEAIGLQWRHISEDMKWITFEVQVTEVRGIKYRKATKNKKTRRFQINPKLKELLLSIKPENPGLNDPVFPSQNGCEIDNSGFNGRIWKGGGRPGGTRGGKPREPYKGIVTELAEKGIISRYLPQYNTRHTFCTLALDAGFSVPQVADWVGDIPGTVLKHYAGKNAHIMTPEF